QNNEEKMTRRDEAGTSSDDGRQGSANTHSNTTSNATQQKDSGVKGDGGPTSTTSQAPNTKK
ncbi:unnamed protein product, partial [Didymodactylos carnosus]